MKKIYAVTDLGPGDGGKGGVVHKLSRMRNAHTILKVGGAQGSHGVSTSEGYRFAFSQFGCGTFEGVRTHLTERFVASPVGILNEANALRYEHGMHDVYSLLTVDEDVVCATPYHRISSRLKELARGANPRGTIGTGVGEAIRYNLRFPDLTIRARDLSRSDLRDRLAAVRDLLEAELEPLIDGGFLLEDRLAASDEAVRLYDSEYLDYVTDTLRDVSRKIRVVGKEHFRSLLARDGVMVVESSHGVLTDEYYGFHPHTSALRTLPCYAEQMIKDQGYDGDMVRLGVTRAYQIRHGAGPMPTADPAMAEDLLPGSHKEENRFQGKVRVGPLDLVMLRYALAASGGPGAFDGLAVTWFDQIERNGVWKLCNSYQNADDPAFFTPKGELEVWNSNGMMQLAHQQTLGHRLNGCMPVITEHKIESGISQDDLYALCAGVLKEALEVDVRMVSFGPTDRDKLCR